MKIVMKKATMMIEMEKLMMTLQYIDKPLKIREDNQ